MPLKQQLLQVVKLTLFISLILFSIPGLTNDEHVDDSSWSKQKKLVVTNIVSLGLIATWGFTTWDYGTNESHFHPDDWFTAHAKHGGADKTGHAYATYALSHIYAHLYEDWGYSHRKAATYGALSGLAMHLFVEFGDSFSDYGFSNEDMLMNTVGATVAFILYYNPVLHRILDYRVEYIPTFTQYDFFTDYDGLKYILALKLAGFKSLRNTWAAYFELQGGFYARGYEEKEEIRTRNVYAAIGINLSEILRRHTPHIKTANIFEYIQVPYTYIPVTKTWSHYEPKN